MADALVTMFYKKVKLKIFGGQYKISGLIDKLQTLMDEVKNVKEYLGDAANTLQAEQLREMDLERQLKEVVYDVVDTVESSSSRMAAVMARNKLFRQSLIQRLGEAQERAIESIRSRRLEPITRRIQAYKDLGIQQTHSTETNQGPSEQLKKKVQPAAPEKFVGLEDEVETLISSLLEETERLDVIAITGMPGIGKTTLASKIYHDKRIRQMFPTPIWVDDFRTKELCLDILKQCKNSASCSKDSSIGILNYFSHLNDDELKDAVRDSLKKSKYLLIMDGVWDADSLKSVTDMLPQMGKALITSRNNHITAKPHVLRFLNEKESWELLQLEVFGKLDECPEMLKSTGECIARNCDGLPLAIAAAGNSLMVSSSTEAANLTEKWWEAVFENVTMYVTDYGAQHRVLERVELSYIKLPQHLQECFLYLGVFPEGHEIPVRTLVRLWIAEGLLHDQLSFLSLQILDETGDGGLQTLEETAAQYLHDLIDRNLVMVVKRYTDGQIKTCRLHKLIYGFCKYKAAEEDLYQEIKMTGDRPISLTPYSHRLCIYSDLSKFHSGKPKERHARSILCFKEEENVVLSHKKGFRIHEWFKLLRVLECRHVNFTRFPDRLNKLIHLRYISLSCDEIRVIPKTIATLRYLETLVVDTQSSSLQLQANIWRMMQLRHLVTKAAIVLAIPREGEVARNLRTLTRLAPACCTKDVFRGTPNLKTLGIRGHLATLAKPESWIELKHLENLKLINESAADCQLHLDCFPLNLRRLTLSGTYLKWECMSVLGTIYSLEILKLKNNAFTGESWTSRRADGFGCLRFLLIGTTDLVSWEASADCFPTLKYLELKNCEKLQKVPSSLAKSLDTLDVGNVPESVVESAREIQEEIARRQG